MEDGFKKTEEDNRELQNVVESVDNAMRRHHLRLKGLKERVDGDDLKACVESLLIASLGSTSNDDIKLQFARRLGSRRRGKGNNRDRDIILYYNRLYRHNSEI